MVAQNGLSAGPCNHSITTQPLKLTNYIIGSILVTLPGLVVQGNSLYRGLWLFLPQKWFEAPQRAWLRLEKLFFPRGFSGCHKYVAPGNETKIFLPHICGTRRYWVNRFV